MILTGHGEGTWFVWADHDGQMHAIPANEDHDHARSCWCRPTLDDGVLVHHSCDETPEKDHARR